jgi:hypothetical protein
MMPGLFVSLIVVERPALMIGIPQLENRDVAIASRQRCRIAAAI